MANKKTENIDNIEIKETISPAVAEVNSLVEKALVALEEFRKLDQEQVDYIVAKASVAALDQHGVLADAAIIETGHGIFEDRVTYQLFCDVEPDVIIALGGGSPMDAAKGVELFAQAVMNLGKEIGIDMNFASQGIDEQEWLGTVHAMALLAYEDQCAPANPSLPMIKDMEAMMIKAYKAN